MSLFDILNSPDLQSSLGSFARKAKSTASEAVSSAPGGMGGLLGAGALGALIGTFVSKDVLKDAALVGAGAVAWNFYQKWSQNRSGQTPGSAPASAPSSSPWGAPASAPSSSSWGALASPSASVPAPAPVSQVPAPAAPVLDDTAMLLLRAMIYTARADGHVDAAEQARISRLVEQMFPGQDISPVLHSLMNDPIDPSVLAAGVQSQEQAEDLFRLSLLIVDVDHFMEKSYLDALASSLNIAAGRRQILEGEVAQARTQLLPA